MSPQTLCSLLESCSPHSEATSKVLFFFFPRKSLRTHSLTRIWKSVFFSAKRGKKKKQPFWSVFFFPGKVYKPLTHSIWKAVFFLASEKKTPFLLTHSNMGKIFQKTNFSRKKKKQYLWPGHKKIARFLYKNNSFFLLNLFKL